MVELAAQGTQERKPERPAREPRGRVMIFNLWCKGCRLCVEFCPTGVFTFNSVEGRPVITCPENCTACHWCDTHCPDLAIVVTGIEK